VAVWSYVTPIMGPIPLRHQNDPRPFNISEMPDTAVPKNHPLSLYEIILQIFVQKSKDLAKIKNVSLWLMVLVENVADGFRKVSFF
jgi:hypothetical protein